MAKKIILIKGSSGQTVAEELEIIHANCKIPGARGAKQWSEIQSHPEHGDYIDNIVNPWNDMSPEEILKGTTFKEVEIEIEEINFNGI